MTINDRLAEIEARAIRMMEGCAVEECAVCAGERERLRLVAALRVAVAGCKWIDKPAYRDEIFSRIEAALKGGDHAAD